MEFIALTLIVHTVSKQYESDQTHSAASDMVLHCLPISHKTYARFLWVKSANGNASCNKAVAAYHSPCSEILLTSIVIQWNCHTAIVLA